MLACLPAAAIGSGAKVRTGGTGNMYLQVPFVQ